MANCATSMSERSLPSRWQLLMLALLPAGFALAAGHAGTAGPPGPALGKPLSAEQRAALAGTSVFPDGRGLPTGQGQAREGAVIYASRCASCHGSGGRGGSGGVLISGEPITAPDADRDIDNYWPWATTLFDYTRRAMPLDAPGSLSVDQTYAVTAYLLVQAGLLEPDAVLDAGRLAALRMPNRDGFVGIDASVTRGSR